MRKILNIFIYLALFTSAVTLSACASKSEPAPVVTPAPVEAVVEAPAAPVIAVEPVPEPAQAAVAEQPQVSAQEAPKKTMHKAKKKLKRKAAAPAPVVQPPAPVEYKAPEVVQPEPTPPVAVAPPPPAPVVAEPGFLEKYWLWLLGVLIAIVGIAIWWKKNQE